MIGQEEKPLDDLYDGVELFSVNGQLSPEAVKVFRKETAMRYLLEGTETLLYLLKPEIDNLYANPNIDKKDGESDKSADRLTSHFECYLNNTDKDEEINFSSQSYENDFVKRLIEKIEFIQDKSKLVSIEYVVDKLLLREFELREHNRITIEEFGDPARRDLNF